MMKKTSAIVAMFIVAGAAFGQAPSLSVGSPAPKLAVAKWVKGEPTTQFGDGKVRVVEFWATWCGPCKTSIPHLTELAKKYKGKASFTGISVWENKSSATDTSYYKKVEEFVKTMGPKMDYNIAIDGPAGVVSDTWMKAAGQNGIPTAFVVNQQGKVAWIGHPMAELDEVVGKVIDGTYDVAAEAKRQAEEKRKQAELQSALAPLSKAYQAKDWQKVASEAKKVMETHPEMASRVGVVRFNALLKIDEPGAYAFAKSVSSTLYKNEAGALNTMAWTIVDDASLKSPNYYVAVELAEKAVKLTREADPNILDTLGLALFKKGDKARAILIQEKAVKIANAPNAVDPATLKEMSDRLARFKKG